MSEPVVNLTGQSSDSAKDPLTNETDESEQTTSSDPPDEILQ